MTRTRTLAILVAAAALIAASAQVALAAETFPPNKPDSTDVLIMSTQFASRFVT